LVLLVLPTLASHHAFADGLFQENLPPASIGDRDASLFVKINPPILTTETEQDAFLQFRLFDAKNDETIKFTTFVIEVTKGTDPNTRPLLRDVFHTESGLLTLKIQPEEGEVRVFATKEDFLQAYKADPGGTINIRGPILLEGGLYRFKIDVLTVDNIRNLFAPGDEPSFETFLSVGDIYKADVQSGDQTYSTTVISYYDKVQDFRFDPATLTYSWSMPFDWNVERIQAAASLFVHEEIIVPKSFRGVGDSVAFNASVNGVPISGRMLSLDPFSSEEELTLHFLLNRNDIISLAQQLSDKPNTMQFEFFPVSDGGDQTSGEIATDTGGMLVLLVWSPDQLTANTDLTLGLEFHDAFSGDRITKDVTYDLRTFDPEGYQLHSFIFQLAEGGSDSLTLTFPTDEKYRIEVEVKEVTFDGQAPDLTRNGIARGIVVVPEFPMGAILAVAGALGSIIMFQRLARKA